MSSVEKINSGERWTRVQQVFDDALERPPAEREGFVITACADDTALRRAVLRLLVADEGSAGFLSTPAFDAHVVADEDGSSPAADTDANTGRQIGAYRIVRLIGAGGMGSVYLAERADGVFTRQVALKVIKRGMDTTDILHRFHTERQVLANLEHPNIARLIDGGSTDDGLPYLVMEYVEGQRIDDFCDSRSLAIDDRLRLFRAVCSAVHFAHQNLVVHRDLKPGNILVAEADPPEAGVKLLDFGIAKVLAPDRSARTSEMTSIGNRRLTPAYASPEQVRGSVITTAVDVYALGVVLYELLTGRRPYRITTATPREIEQAICEDEPSRLATVIRQPVDCTSADGRSSTRSPEAVCALRGTDPERLRRRLAGDLETIVSTALAKDPARRYGSAERLSEDIRRFLGHEPIEAEPPGMAYRFRLLVRRNRALAIAVSVIALVVVAASIVSTTFAIRESRAARAAFEQRATAEEVKEFLGGILASANPDLAQGREVTVLDALDAASVRIDAELHDRPTVEAAIRTVIGTTYVQLGRYDRAETHLRRSLQIQRQRLGAGHEDTLGTIRALGLLLHEKGEYEEAMELCREAREGYRQMLGDEHPRTLAVTNNLAWFLFAHRRLDEAEPLFRQTLAARRRVLGANDAETLRTMISLGEVLREQGRLDEAVRYYEEAVDRSRAELGDGHPVTSYALDRAAEFHRQRGDLERAESLARDAVAIRERVLGDRHPHTFWAVYTLAQVCRDRGRFAEAELLYRRTIDGRREVLGATHPETLGAEDDLGLLLLQLGRYEELETMTRRCVDVRRRLLGDDHPSTLAAMSLLADGKATRRRRIPDTLRSVNAASRDEDRPDPENRP